MKKYFAFTVLAALLLAACAKEEIAPMENADSIAGTYEFTLTASMDTELTKTAYASDKYFSWSAGDQISVLFHKGGDNKFFTLTTSNTGSSASFSGTIEAGYEIGASDDATKRLALFPAGAHTYTAGNNPVFNIPAMTDFTKTHFSANLPMAAIGDGDNKFSFYHLSGAYKVVFGSIDASVSKVILNVKNQNTKKLSGDYTLQDDITRWWDEWAAEGSADQKVSYVVNVVEGKATFYIPYGHNQNHFLPEFTLKNAVNGNTLKTVTAKNQEAFIGSENERLPLKTRLVVLPEIPAPGTGTAPGWKSNHAINWDLVDQEIPGATSSSYSGINSIKVTSDAENLYILLDAKTSFLLDNDSYDNANLATLYVGDGTDTGSSFASWWWPLIKYQSTSAGWLKTGNDYTYTAKSGSIVDNIANISGEHCYYEIAYPRSEIAALQSTSAYIGFIFNQKYKTGGSESGSSDAVGYAPTTGSGKSMIQITMVEYGNMPPTPLPANHSFTEADGDVANPERGFYKHFEYKFDGGSTPSTTIANYTFDEPLVLTIFYLRDYRTSDNLDDAVLNKFNAEMNATRAKGKKAIVRFAYTWKDEDPHDPSPEQVLNHLDDLAPYFAAHEDVIYLVQAGFIGTYGEWYYKDDDFKWTLSGSTLTNYGNASSVIAKMLEVVPESRQIALRTSFYKRWYLYPFAINTLVPDISSWGTSANQRIGYFNDGFRGSSNDIGTFNSDQDRTQWYGQGQWLVCGGESAYVGTDSNHNGTIDPDEKQAWIDANSSLANPDNSIAAMKEQHFSYLHYAASNILMDYWAGPGGDVSCGTNRIPDFQKALGYRLVLGDVALTGSLTNGSTVSYSIALQNKGCARVIYPRPCKLVLIHNGTATVVKSNLTDVRNLAPGADATVLEGSFILPQDVYQNDKLAIWLPDNDEDLQATPAYSIHLANSDITWDNGYNIIHTF